MHQSNQLIDLTDQEVAQRCREESEQRQAHPQSSYCYELFRRAIDGGSQAAWTAIYQQYEALIHSWIVHLWDKLGYRGVDDVLDDLSQKVYLKFLEAFQEGEYTLIRFPTIGQLMGLWRTLTRNAVIDLHRKLTKRQEIQGLDEVLESLDVSHYGSEPDLNIERLDQQNLIRYIQHKLKTDEERLIFKLRFEFDMKPAEIAKQHPHKFASSEAVSTVSETIKRRLKRDPVIEKLLDDLGFC